MAITAAEIGKRLREASADRSGPTSSALDECRRLLAMEHADVNDANRNGKRALHFAAQLRADTDVLELLIAAKADVNAATHRGHTPLIYASGRGRAFTVRCLLENGADAACWTVQGVCCVSMGRKKGLPEELLAELEANQACSPNPRDFRGDERAMRAQQEHYRHCACCRRKRDEVGATRADEEPPTEKIAVRECAMAFGEAALVSVEALSSALLDATRLEPPTLRRAIEFSLTAAMNGEETEGPVASCELLLRASGPRAPPSPHGCWCHVRVDTGRRCGRSPRAKQCTEGPGGGGGRSHRGGVGLALAL
jgi:hypothetical protein